MSRIQLKKMVFLLVIMALVINIDSDDKKALNGDWGIKLAPKPNNTLEHTDKPFDDTLTFKDGKVNSKVCKGYEFETASYAKKVANGKTEYIATMKSSKHGSAIWRFTVEAKKIEGTFHWDNEGKSASFTFAGELKTEDSK